MENSREGRSQAHIEKIVSLTPIPNADRIEVAQVLGWECVVRKGDFKVGDYCVYIEIDSIVPATPTFEFLEKKRYRVRTIRLRKQISQGLALPLDEDTLKKIGELKEGKDVSEILDIKKYDPLIQKERRAREKQHKGLTKFLMRYSWFRKLYVYLFYVDKSFPEWIPKTDEHRIQNRPSLLRKDNIFYVTEKLDGQSTTIYHKPSLKRKKKRFGVCSRNISLDPKGKGNWQDVARKYDLKERLSSKIIKKMYEDGLAIQGEIVGPGIQGNKYRRRELELYLFNIYDIHEQEFLPIKEMILVSEILGVPFVPILDMTLSLSGLTMKGLLSGAEGKSKLEGCEDVEREGLVARTYDQSISFKAISNKFLEKEAKEEEKEDV